MTELPDSLFSTPALDHEFPVRRNFVYFNHGIHVAKGIGCETCHGRLDQMPLTWKQNTLYMRWCLDCHQDPGKYIRPRDQVFNMNYVPPADQLAFGTELVNQYAVHKEQLTNCSVCHR